MGKFFSFLDPSREGPGVSKNAPQKKRFFLFFDIYFRKFTKIILLNIIYVITCIPIITIGPATAGLTYCMRNFAREEHAEISDFFDQFKKNFWQSIAVSLILFFGTIIIVFGVVFYYFMMLKSNILGFFGFVLSMMAGFIFIGMSYYFYMMIVTFKLKIWQLLKNAFIFSIACIGTNIIITLLLGIIYGWFFIYGIFPTVLPLFNPEAPVYLEAVCLAFAMYLFFIPSLTSLIVNFNIYPHVKKFLIDPAMREKEAEREKEEAIFEDEI